MRAEELWKAYCEKENIDIDTPYEAWGFGNAPDKLADLVLKGMKTATASGYDLYFIEGEEEQFLLMRCVRRSRLLARPVVTPIL